jgi:hypothetical protein
MSIEPIKTEVRGLLAETNDQLRQAERSLAQGAGEERVHAAGRLVLLRRHQAELQARMGELARSPDGVGPTVFQWIKEDWMILMRSLGHWIEAR